jgi:transcriptional regulator with XRE-family HTH domain
MGGMLCRTQPDVKPALYPILCMGHNMCRTLTSVVTLTALGDALKQIREGKGLKLRDIEDLAGFDKGNLSKLERGKVEPGKSGYSHESLGRLADALETPLSQVYALAEEIQNGAATPDTVRLVITMESLPEKSRGSIREIIDTVAQSTTGSDGIKRHSTDRAAGRLLNRPS